MADVDRLAALQATDAGYHALVAEGSPFFHPGSGTSGLIQKIN